MANFIKYMLPLLAILFDSAECWLAPFKSVTQYQNGVSLLVATDKEYALRLKPSEAHEMFAISVDSESKVSVVFKNCTRYETTFLDLSSEHRSLIASEMKAFEVGFKSEKNPTFVAEFYDKSEEWKAGRELALSHVINSKENRSYLMWEAMACDRKVGTDFSIARIDAKREVSRIFFVEGNIAIVYLDGRVRMQPKECLQGADLVVATQHLEDNKLN